MAELKEDGQVSGDTAHNLRLTCSYITRGGRAAARPHAGASTSFAFCSSICLCLDSSQLLRAAPRAAPRAPYSAKQKFPFLP
eukprot:COSAG04_NODE_5505_length_1591_cov_2.619973_2_plen_82_part_00